MKKNAIIFSFLIGLLWFVLFAYAQDTVKMCVSNTTLEINETFALYINASRTNITISEREVCNYGCDNITLSCSPNPFNLNLNILYSILGGIFVIGAIGFVWKKAM